MRYSLEPVMFSLAIIRKKEREKTKCWRHLGFVPSMKDVSNLPDNRPKHMRRTPLDPEVKANIYHRSLDLILEGLVEAQRNPPTVLVNLGGLVKKVKVHLPVCFIMGDQKSNDMMCLRISKIKFPPRIHRGCNSSWQTCLRGRPSGCDYLRMDLVESMCFAGMDLQPEHLVPVAELIRSVVMEHVLQIYNVDNAFWKVDFGDQPHGIYQATVDDNLHMSEGGVLEHMSNVLLDHTSPNEKAMLDHLAETLLSRQAIRSTLRPRLPRINFVKGWTRVAQSTHSEKVGRLLSLVLMSKSEDGLAVLDRIAQRNQVKYIRSFWGAEDLDTTDGKTVLKFYRKQVLQPAIAQVYLKGAREEIHCRVVLALLRDFGFSAILDAKLDHMQLDKLVYSIWALSETKEFLKGVRYKKRRRKLPDKSVLKFDFTIDTWLGNQYSKYVLGDCYLEKNYKELFLDPDITAETALPVAADAQVGTDSHAHGGDSDSDSANDDKEDEDDDVDEAPLRDELNLLREKFDFTEEDCLPLTGILGGQPKDDGDMSESESDDGDIPIGQLQLPPGKRKRLGSTSEGEGLPVTSGSALPKPTPPNPGATQNEGSTPNPQTVTAVATGLTDANPKADKAVAEPTKSPVPSKPKIPKTKDIDLSEHCGVGSPLPTYHYGEMRALDKKAICRGCIRCDIRDYIVFLEFALCMNAFVHYGNTLSPKGRRTSDMHERFCLFVFAFHAFVYRGGYGSRLCKLHSHLHLVALIFLFGWIMEFDSGVGERGIRKWVKAPSSTAQKRAGEFHRQTMRRVSDQIAIDHVVGIGELQFPTATPTSNREKIPHRPLPNQTTFRIDVKKRLVTDEPDPERPNCIPPQGLVSAICDFIRKSGTVRWQRYVTLSTEYVVKDGSVIRGHPDYGGLPWYDWICVGNIMEKDAVPLHFFGCIETRDGLFFCVRKPLMRLETEQRSYITAQFWYNTNSTFEILSPSGRERSILAMPTTNTSEGLMGVPEEVRQQKAKSVTQTLVFLADRERDWPRIFLRAPWTEIYTALNIPPNSQELEDMEAGQDDADDEGVNVEDRDVVDGRPGEGAADVETMSI
jgi:hypothetical protein